MAKSEYGIFCAKCSGRMILSLLPTYEYEVSYPLHNVEAFRCLACGNVFFTEDQAKALKARTKELKEYSFGFERKVTVSGKSLVLGVPFELAEHLNIKQGQKVRIIPIAKEGFLVKTRR